MLECQYIDIDIGIDVDDVRRCTDFPCGFLTQTARICTARPKQAHVIQTDRQTDFWHGFCDDRR